jgi:RNA polymerase sigma factor (TIGR02999 family)
MSDDRWLSWLDVVATFAKAPAICSVIRARSVSGRVRLDARPRRAVRVDRKWLIAGTILRDAFREILSIMTRQAPPATLTLLLQLASRGERDAMNRVFEALYPDLRRIAHSRLRQRGGVAHLETTALVHESFLRLMNNEQLALGDRKHFFTYSAKTMRNIILELAREQLAQRRGGGHADLELDTSLANELPAKDGEATLIAVNDALLELEKVDPTLAQVVEMRYFAGYTEPEVAELTGTSERTVRRQWEKARAFLLASLQE